MHMYSNNGLILVTSAYHVFIAEQIAFIRLQVLLSHRLLQLCKGDHSLAHTTSKDQRECVSRVPVR